MIGVNTFFKVIFAVFNTCTTMEDLEQKDLWKAYDLLPTTMASP